VAAHAVGALVTSGHDRPEPDPDHDVEPRLLLSVGLLVHAGLIAGALLWLWSRDRLPVVSQRAIGEYGPWLAALSGVAVGWLGAQLLAAASPRLRRMREYEAVARHTFERAGDMATILFVTFGAVAEELFFRLAVQDVFGLVGSVAIAAVVNSCIAGWAWLPIGALHAVALGLLVQHGFGLLASTTASAVMNYLNLRRIQCGSNSS
jgi:hypothetical protein